MIQFGDPFAVLRGQDEEEELPEEEKELIEGDEGEGEDPLSGGPGDSEE